MCSLVSLLGLFLLLCSVVESAAIGDPPTIPPEKIETSGGDVHGVGGAGGDASGGSGRGSDADPEADDTAAVLPEIQQQQGPSQQQWQQEHQLTPRGGVTAIPLLLPWMNMFRFLDLPPLDTSRKSPLAPQLLPGGNSPQVRADVNDTSDIAKRVAGFPESVPEVEPKGGDPLTTQLKTIRLPATGITGTPEARLNWLQPEGQLTPEEEEEEALADAIIHGTGKKQVPRVRTAVDALVDAIEDEKLRQVAKTPGQLAYLRRRRQAEMKARKSPGQLPEYFTNLAKEAAAYHKRKHDALQKWEAEHPMGVLGEQLRILARRRQQKDKLLLWRENQIYQSPEEGPDVDKQIAEAHKTDKELERFLLKDLSKEDLQWAAGSEETQTDVALREEAAGDDGKGDLIIKEDGEGEQSEAGRT